MKVLDVHGFHTGTKEIQKNIKLLQEQIEAIREAVHQIIHLEDSLKGKGGESIRNYYQHIHETFLQFFQSFLTNYDTIIGEMQRALQQFEPAENGFIHEGFVDMNVPQGLKKIRDITESLTNEANQIMASVQDIVFLPRLQDEATLRGIEQGRVRAKKTIEDLYFFDQQATRSLDIVEKDIQTMTEFVQQANAMFEGDKRIIIDFNPEKLMEGEGYRNLVAELYSFTEEENKSALDKIIGLEKTEIPISKGEIPWGPGRIIKVGELGKVVKVISKRLLPKMSKGTGKSGADNIAFYAKYKEVLKVTESANPIVDSLRQTGKLPSYYVNKDVAVLNGWKPGKALNNYVSGGQLGGDVFKNTTNVLPNAPGRVWYEADVGLKNTMARSKQPGSRLLYSNDGQMYITNDHYKTVHFIGTYK